MKYRTACLALASLPQISVALEYVGHVFTNYLKSLRAGKKS